MLGVAAWTPVNCIAVESRVLRTSGCRQRARRPIGLPSAIGFRKSRPATCCGRRSQDGTRVGALVRETLQSGALVGDDLMISLVAERLEEPDTAKGFVLDGFPRTIPQAAALDAMLAERGGVIVIALVVHVDEVVRRLSVRGREDDEAWVIKERLAVYSRETEPVLEYYRRRSAVTILDGNRPLDDVTRRSRRPWRRPGNKPRFSALQSCERRPLRG